MSIFSRFRDSLLFSESLFGRSYERLPHRPPRHHRDEVRNVVRFAWWPVRVHVIYRQWRGRGCYLRSTNLGRSFVWLRWYYWQACGAFELPSKEHYIIVDLFD